MNRLARQSPERLEIQFKHRVYGWTPVPNALHNKRHAEELATSEQAREPAPAALREQYVLVAKANQRIVPDLARLAQIEALRPRMEHFLDTACSMSRAEVLFMTSRLLRDLLTLLDAPQPQAQTEPT